MQEVLVSKIFNYTSTPTKNVEGQFWFNPSTNVLSRFNGTAWKPITVSSDDVAVLTDGNKVSLTSYLNTQIAALAEGIDSKQDKLASYSEETLPPEAGLTGGKTVVGINALTLSVTVDKQFGSTYFKGGPVSIEDKLSANELSVSGSISGNAVLSSISNKPVDTKILSEKAVSDALTTKQNNLKYYSEDSTKTVSKLSSKRLEVNTYNESGSTYNPLILNDKQGIAIGGSNLQNLYAYLDIGDSTGTSLVLSTPAGNADLSYDSITFEDPSHGVQYGFSNKTYNLLTERAAGLYYLKDTNAKSTGIAINPDGIILSDYNSYNGAADEDSYFEATTIGKGVINLQQRTNGSSQFIDTGSIKPDTIKLHNGKRDSEYDYNSDIVITGSRTSGFATNFHGIAYSGTQYNLDDGTSMISDTQWFIGRTVDGDNFIDNSLYPTYSKPYIKGFANAEFSEKVQATTIQAGKEVSANSGVATLTEGALNINTHTGYANFKFDGIEISNACFKVQGGGLDAYIQIPDGHKSSFKIWKGTETEFKALTSVNSDTVYLRVQDNNRIKATVGADTASLENITDSYTLSSAGFTSFITDTKYNNAQGSILITPSLTNSGALIFGENITDISKGFPLYPDNIVSIPFKNITNFKVAGNLNDSFNYIISFDI